MGEDSLQGRAEQASESFLREYGNEITAVGTLLLVLLALFVVDRFLARRAASLAREIAGGRIDPVAQTRLRFVRRLAAASIVVFGVATALSQFDALDRFAATVLTSGAIAAAVIGFAAQQTLANLIAGILLAVTQPVRIGDLVAFDEHTGVVEDIRLAHTFLQTGADARVIVPNARLVGAVLRNDSIVTDTVGVEVELWLDHASDELRAMELIAEQVEGARAAVRAVTPEGTTLAITGQAVPPPERPARETQLRHDCLHVLRAAGLR